MNLEMKPIGIIRTPFSTRDGMPIQPSGALGVKGRIELFPEFLEGISDLDGFSHIMLLYVFHKSDGYSLKVTPFLDTVPRGVFATRAPRRPNPLGVSVVRLEAIESCTLHITDVDILDQTPLLDIKPYVPAFEPRDVPGTGWLAKAAGAANEVRSDDRFVENG